MLFLTYGTPTFWFDYGSYDQQTSYNVLANTIYEIEYYKGHGTINGEAKLSERTATYTFNHPLYVFAVNGDGQAIYPAKMRLYSMQIKDSYEGTLIRDFIPCYQKNTNKAGLYDKINNVFYENKGSGAFIPALSA